MTTIREELVTCVLCEEQTLLPVLTSTSSFGPPDLDLRPSEPARSSIFAWVQRCGSCGYCAPTIAEAAPYTRAVVEGIPYRAVLGDSSFPDLARSLLCSSLVFEETGEEARAARNAIEAAWVCDDEDAPEPATRCRLRAVELLHKSESEGDELFGDPVTEYAVIVDLLRRAGAFDEAVAEADAALDEADGIIATVLAFSRQLALTSDFGRYTVEDAAPSGADDR